jgi:hypothetical protein
VTRLISYDRAKVAARKGKGKECLNSQSESFSVIGDIISTLKKLSSSFTKTQMWKQYNKFWDRSITNIDDEELVSHRETLRLIEKDLQFTTQNTTEVQNKDDE